LNVASSLHREGKVRILVRKLGRILIFDTGILEVARGAPIDSGAKFGGCEREGE
jgi:hypothetical protein